MLYAPPESNVTTLPFTVSPLAFAPTVHATVIEVALVSVLFAGVEIINVIGSSQTSHPPFFNDNEIACVAGVQSWSLGIAVTTMLLVTPAWIATSALQLPELSVAVMLVLVVTLVTVIEATPPTYCPPRVIGEEGTVSQLR